jgi:hypothetical protein
MGRLNNRTQRHKYFKVEADKVWKCGNERCKAVMLPNKRGEKWTGECPYCGSMEALFH